VSLSGAIPASIENVKWLKLLLSLAMAAMVALPMSAKAQETADDAASLKQFDAAIAAYLAMRQRLMEEVPGPAAGSSSVQLNQASDALAAAIQRSRPKARPGDLFQPPVTAIIKQRVIDAVRRDNLAEALATIDDEEKGPAKPAIHMRFPAASPMATMPPSLLAVLPRLPASLEYRIIGEVLILRDVEAALILDLIPAAVPRQ
jgi:hypothetical protein